MKLLPFAFLIALAAATVGTGGCTNRPEAPTMEDPIVAREDAQRITADAIDLDKRGDIDGAIAGYQRAIDVADDSAGHIARVIRLGKCDKPGITA